MQYRSVDADQARHSIEQSPRISERSDSFCPSSRPILAPNQGCRWGVVVISRASSRNGKYTPIGWVAPVYPRAPVTGRDSPAGWTPPRARPMPQPHASARVVPQATRPAPQGRGVRVAGPERNPHRSRTPRAVRRGQLRPHALAATTRCWTRGRTRVAGPPSERQIRHNLNLRQSQLSEAYPRTFHGHVSVDALQVTMAASSHQARLVFPAVRRHPCRPRANPVSACNVATA